MYEIGAFILVQLSFNLRSSTLEAVRLIRAKYCRTGALHSVPIAPKNCSLCHIAVTDSGSGLELLASAVQCVSLLIACITL